MSIHQFGGGWTQKKLETVKNYLIEYSKIFEKNEKARYFHTTYVDAFAGSGDRADSSEDSDSLLLKKGSARIALEVDPGFKSYLFIESDSAKVKDLEQLKTQFVSKADRVKIVQGDANDVLQDWIKTTDWNKHRAVVFLDPYGMQVKWETIRAIAATQAIDLWLLFPFSLLNRLLTKDNIPPVDWCEKLNVIFGTNEWLTEFYKLVKADTLFGEEESTVKHGQLSNLKKFIMRRLNSVFYAVADNPAELVNSKGSPLFLLCFAAANERGSKTAIRIATHLLKHL